MGVSGPVVTQQADRAVNELARAIEQTRRDVADLKAYSDISVTLASGDTIVNHKLGRTPSGWIIIDIQGAADVYRVAWSARSVTLNSSAAVSAKIRFL